MRRQARLQAGALRACRDLEAIGMVRVFRIWNLLTPGIHGGRCPFPSRVIAKPRAECSVDASNRPVIRAVHGPG